MIQKLSLLKHSYLQTSVYLVEFFPIFFSDGLMGFSRKIKKNLKTWFHSKKQSLHKKRIELNSARNSGQETTLDTSTYKIHFIPKH